LFSAAFSPDGTRIVTGSSDNTARVWDATSGASIAELKGHANTVTSAVFSADGTRIVTASRDGMARVWDTTTGANLSELNGHSSSIESVAFSPNGTRIVTASEDDTVRVWDTATGASLAEIKGHTRSVSSATFSPDGTRIVTASQDGTARIWDSVPYRERFPAIEAARKAEAKVRPLIDARLKAGETIEQIRQAVASDRSMPEIDRTAYLSVTQAMIDTRSRSSK
jgi:WD40 repeat protein